MLISILKNILEIAYNTLFKGLPGSHKSLPFFVGVDAPLRGSCLTLDEMSLITSRQATPINMNNCANFETRCVALLSNMTFQIGP